MEQETWKRSVKVDKDATVLMQLPCVSRCEKREDGDYMYRMVDGSYVFEGMWLCETHGGRWRGLNAWEYSREH